MLPFLCVCGSEKGNSLSPFATNIEMPAEFEELIKLFYKPPKIDNRGKAVPGAIVPDTKAVEESSDDASDAGEDAPEGIMMHFLMLLQLTCKI